MDDVDSAHAQAAQHIIDSGDWVTTKVNGIRYIEKPPLHASGLVTNCIPRRR